MLRQPQQFKSYKEPKKFEDAALYQKEDERLPIEHALGWSVASHGMVTILLTVVPIILVLLGINISLFDKPKPKMKDIEFVLVNQPEQEPIDKNTRLRAERNTRAGGEHDPNKKIAPPQPAAVQSAAKQADKATPQKQVKTPQQKAVQPKAKAQEQVKKVVKNKPSAPKPMAKPVIPPTKIASDIKLPIPPTKGIPKLSTVPSGPVSTKPSGSYSGSGSTSAPKPVISSGSYGSGSGIKAPSNGGSYSASSGSVGNPGPGNPKGAPGVDAIKEPNFGPYMSELSRRIKANWDPPRGDESKRVVLLFSIAKDGRLLNVKVVKTSGTPAADKAALAAVELTAPFRPLPVEFKGQSIDIQFTFDYNVFGVNSRF